MSLSVLFHSELPFLDVRFDCTEREEVDDDDDFERVPPDFFFDLDPEEDVVVDTVVDFLASAADVVDDVLYLLPAYRVHVDMAEYDCVERELLFRASAPPATRHTATNTGINPCIVFIFECLKIKRNQSNHSMTI